MASVSRPQQKTHVIDFDDPAAPSVSTPAEVVAVASAVCEFMNKEHVRDIASYVVRFGKKFVCIPPPRAFSRLVPYVVLTVSFVIG